MKSLSIKNPFAQLILQGKKSIEVRSRKTQMRGDILICVSKSAVHSHQVYWCEDNFKNSDDMEKKKLIKQMHAMMAKKGLMHLKPDILGVFEVESTKDLTYEQLETVIMWLNETDSEYELRQKRSVVLYWLGRLGIKGSKQEGWDDVNRYLMQPRIAGKMLYEMSVKELDECTARLRMIHSKAEATSGRINRLKIMN